MPGLARKLLIFAAVDGLILQPYATSQRGNNNNNNHSSALQIEYNTRRILSYSSLPSSPNYKNETSLEAHGIVGLLSVSSYSFLISITQRQQVAQILGKPIFVITGVAIIPLSSQAEASKAIKQAQLALKKNSNKDKQDATSYESSDSESEQSDISNGEEGEGDGEPEPLSSPDMEVYQPTDGTGDKSTVAEDVIEKQGRYGRFASRWFSKRGWTRAGPRTDGGLGVEGGPFDPAASGSVKRRKRSCNNNEDSMEDALELDEVSSDGRRISPPTPPRLDTQMTTAEETRAHELMPKLLRYTRMLFASRSFYYSYDYDVTRKFGVEESQMAQVPLHRLVDPLYFWNRHLMLPFIECGHHSFVLPLMQGFIGQKEFSVKRTVPPVQPPESQDGEIPSGKKGDKPTSDIKSATEGDGDDTFLLTLISRRSVKRPGLRYLRRGVDDEGNTANTIETEQILSRPSWNSCDKVYSLLQLRGSIPLYFSQSPYYFKPIPVLRHSTETNQISFDRHFHDTARRYGKVQAVCLLDKHGVEVDIGKAYERYVDNFNQHNDSKNGESKLGFEWFDFHSECRGMKYENVKKLVKSIEQTLEDFGDTVVRKNTVLRKQTGIVRTNCMDCLDRTGVAQCAFAQRALEHQLEEEGYTIDLETSSSTQWFNILWADNGDAISKQYSSTAALKGDYTRTRKRDYRGALNDLGLTLSRYFNNIVNDYFSQACIDYLLGIVTTRVFDEFEMNLMSADPGISIEKARQNAIETSCQIVISDESEELVGGWTMLSPRMPNTLRTLPFEQSVLLLTNAAVYSCRFDWDTDKVTSFERIDLRSITSINYGTYITSTLTESQMDAPQNVGIVVVYRAGETSMLRVNTRSLQSLFDQGSESASRRKQSEDGVGEWDITSLFTGTKKSSPKFMAFKLLPRENSSAMTKSPGGAEVSERDAARAICEEIERTVMRGKSDDGKGRGQGQGHLEELSIVKEMEIISLAEARKRTGYLEHLVFDIKKLVWA